MRIALVLLAWVVLLAPAAQAASIEVLEVMAPERTLAGRGFGVSVTLHNHEAEPQDVRLFGALYRTGTAGETCGDQTSDRFVTFTHAVMPRFTMMPGETLTYPPEGERWTQSYRLSDVPPDDKRHVFCVFVGDASRSDVLIYHGQEHTTLLTRGLNAAPSGDFTFEPAYAVAAESVRFVATGNDPEGDALVFTWDLGHQNASGRAKATGAEVSHRFYPEGEFIVTLTVSDGFDETTVSKRVDVAAEADAAAPVAPQDGRRIPGSFTGVAVLCALLVGRSRRR